VSQVLKTKSYIKINHTGYYLHNHSALIFQVITNFFFFSIILRYTTYFFELCSLFYHYRMLSYMMVRICTYMLAYTIPFYKRYLLILYLLNLHVIWYTFSSYWLDFFMTEPTWVLLLLLIIHYSFLLSSSIEIFNTSHI